MVNVGDEVIAERISARQLIQVYISANAYVHTYMVSHFRNVMSHALFPQVLFRNVIGHDSTRH